MWSIILICISLLFGCQGDIADDPKTFRVVSYNVQNLFDAHFDGTEYPEYQNPKKWTERSYRMRLDTLARTLCDSSLSYPDVVVLQEVEGERVVVDLLTSHLARHGYGWYATAREEGGAISIAIISRHPLIEAAVHGHSGGRPVLEASIATDDGVLTIFALHAKSQIGEYEETEAQRLALMQAVGAASARRTGANILVCGDFNQNPDAVWHSGGIQTALVDVSHPKSEEYGEAGSLLITGVRGSMLPSWFYCPYLDEQNTATGSYVYGGVWHQYDQILASYRLFDGVGWEFESFRVCDLPSLVGGDGRPKAWNVQLLDGVSDHLPVLMTLKRR